jgi:hypothetical protein
MTSSVTPSLPSPEAGNKLASLRAMFDKNPKKIKPPTQYEHGKGHAINNLSNTIIQPDPIINLNCSASSFAYSPSSPRSPAKELKTWNPQPRRRDSNNTDRPLFAHDQRPLHPFGKDVNPNSNARELLEHRVQTSFDLEKQLETA